MWYLNSPELIDIAKIQFRAMHDFSSLEGIRNPIASSDLNTQEGIGNPIGMHDCSSLVGIQILMELFEFKGV